MSKHDFYADPTVFDQLLEQSRAWFCARLGPLCPYGWSIGFATLSVVFLGLAVAILIAALRGSISSVEPAWNESLASGIAVVVALAASQSLFRLVLTAWPETIAMPLKLLRLGQAIAWQQAIRKPLKPRAIRKDRRKTTPGERDQVQAFFSGVRAAGVNVAIARALFTAGIRSPQQLLDARDEQLHSIRGVGPATVRKLREHFR